MDGGLHLFTAVNQTLLHWRNAFLLLNLLLDLGHLEKEPSQNNALFQPDILDPLLHPGQTQDRTATPSLSSYLVVALDVELDLLAGEGADPIVSTVSIAASRSCSGGCESGCEQLGNGGLT